MIGATALHTRAQCDECRVRTATRETVAGVFCDTCDTCEPSDAANDDFLGMLLCPRPMCTRCKREPALLRIDPEHLYCSGCWSELDARLLAELNSNTSTSPPDVATTGLPQAASVVAILSQVPGGWSPSDRQTVAAAPSDVAATVTNSIATGNSDRPADVSGLAVVGRDSSPPSVSIIEPKNLATDSRHSESVALSFVQYGCPICGLLSCDWTHGPHQAGARFAAPIFVGLDLASAKYDATSRTFAAIDTASADNSKSANREA